MKKCKTKKSTAKKSTTKKSTGGNLSKLKGGLRKYMENKVKNKKGKKK